MDKIEKIKHYYEIKIFKKHHIADFVVSSAITAQQYKEITGDDYVQ